MQSIKRQFQKILSFLRIRPRVGGLEVSDQVLRLAYSGKKGWQMEAVRIAPGVMERGKIKDAAAFAAALHELKAKIPSIAGKGKKANVVVALSSVNIYTQAFTLPAMEGKDLEKAIDLNVQMASPLDVSKAYFGWQVIGRDEVSVRTEVAAAFVEKTVVDEMTQALYASGFITVGVESRAFALVHTLREKGTGVDMSRSYVLVDVDNSGIDFLIVRKGKLYFEYANQWADLADEKGQIPVEKFKDTLKATMRQVLNFYSQHWPEPLAGAILSAVAFREQAEEAIKESAGLSVIPLTLAPGGPPSPEWFVAFGCGLWDVSARAKAHEINLSGEGAMDTFHEEHILNFLVLWRVLIPVFLACLILILALANSFLGETKANIESSSAFTAPETEAAELSALEASSTAFNQSVAVAASAEAKLNDNYKMIADINGLAAANDVSISHISFQAANTPILVAGSAQSETQIAAFQNAVQADPHFGTVTLPLLNIQPSNGGYTFSMTFPLSTGF
ncbi:MAG TPA: hypothetical protein VMA75_01170 [Candidatus Paceibacterota bacterium]|nr:hypothetical protein [Candidatus Paceibacterota bacterium]